MHYHIVPTCLLSRLVKNGPNLWESTLLGVCMCTLCLQPRRRHSMKLIGSNDIFAIFYFSATSWEFTSSFFYCWFGYCLLFYVYGHYSTNAVMPIPPTSPFIFSLNVHTFIVYWNQDSENSWHESLSISTLKTWSLISQATEECGMLSAIQKHSDTISDGPNPRNVHSHMSLKNPTELICSLHFGTAIQTPGLALILAFPIRGKGII